MNNCILYRLLESKSPKNIPLWQYWEEFVEIYSSANKKSQTYFFYLKRKQPISNPLEKLEKITNGTQKQPTIPFNKAMFLMFKKSSYQYELYFFYLSNKY